MASSMDKDLRSIKDISVFLNNRLRSLGAYQAITVETVDDLESDEYEAFGPGAIKVISIELAMGPIWVTPAMPDVYAPKVGEPVIVTATNRKLSEYIYYNCPFIYEDELIYSEALIFDYGFVDDTPAYKYGGRRAKLAHKNPGSHRIISSSKNYIIGVREDEEELDISLKDGWKLSLNTGDGGTIYIGARNNTTESESAASGGATTIEIDGGTSGNITIKTATGNIELEAGSDATEATVLGETLKGKLEELIDAINAITVNTPLGASSTPNNAASFSSIKSALDEILSSNIKNN